MHKTLPRQEKVLLTLATLLSYSKMMVQNGLKMKPVKPLTRQQILQALRKHDRVFKKLSVTRIGLFGSYAREEQTNKSDIDLIVEFKRPTFDNFMALNDYLEKLFKKKVEILTPEGVDSIRIREVAESIKKSVVYV